MFWAGLLCFILSIVFGPPVLAAPLPRPDGSMIDWHLDRGEGGSAQGLLLFEPGTGCGSVVLNPRFVESRRVAPDFALVAVEKRGVRPGAADRFDQHRCSPAFYHHDTPEERVGDLRHVLTHAMKLPWWNGQLVLVAGSEGCLAVTRLARTMRADAVVLISCATGLPVGEAIARSLPPPLAARMAVELRAARRAPASDRLWLGHPYRWWAAVADRSMPDDVLASTAPMLVVHGSKDTSDPTEAADAFQEAVAGTCRITYREYDGYDHGMTDAAGRPRLAEVFDAAGQWVADRLANGGACAGG